MPGAPRRGNGSETKLSASFNARLESSVSEPAAEPQPEAKEACLRQLPLCVKKKRLQVKSGKDVGNHLTLFWDQPSLVPPKQLLTDQLL